MYKIITYCDFYTPCYSVKLRGKKVYDFIKKDLISFSQSENFIYSLTKIVDSFNANTVDGMYRDDKTFDEILT